MELTFIEYVKLIWGSYWMLIVPILMLLIVLYLYERGLFE